MALVIRVNVKVILTTTTKLMVLMLFSSRLILAEAHSIDLVLLEIYATAISPVTVMLMVMMPLY